MMRAFVRVCLCLLVASASSVVVPASAAAALPAGCYRSDRFTGSVAQMEHWLKCKHATYRVVDYQGPNPPPPPTTDGVYPSCYWTAGPAKLKVAKVCYNSQNVPTLTCIKYYKGEKFADHCTPAAYVNMVSMTGGWFTTAGAWAGGLAGYVHDHFPTSAAKACIETAIPGGGTGLIVKLLGTGKAIGIYAGLAMGCVGGLVRFWWGP